MKPSLLVGLAAVGLIHAAAPARSDTLEIQPLVVTASRTEQAGSETLARVSIIDREQISRSQAPDLLELLRLEVGIDIARTGGPGGQTSLFMRGTNSNHVLVLIDGVRVAAAGSGAFAWEKLDPALIDRIEIVRGPRAARWGSDAIGGVIQIFTRQASGAMLRAAYGRYDDTSLSAALGNDTLSVTAAWRQVGGFSAQNTRGFAYDPDDDGFDNLSLAARGALETGSGSWSWTGRISDGAVEFDQGESDMLDYALRTVYHHRTGSRWRWQASAGLYRDRLDTETAFGQTETVTRRTQAAVQAERSLEQLGIWLVGIDAWRVSGVNRNSWSNSRHNIGVWTGLQGSRQDHDWEASLRLDEDQQFGSAVTGSIAAGWQPRGDWRLFASLGRAFRAPTFSQLYSPGFGGLFAGNPTLDPEASWSLELGADWTPSRRQRVELSVFQTRIDDLIDFAGEGFQAINIGRARIRGAELSHTLELGRLSARSGYTWQDAEDRDTGAALLRRARGKASLSADYRLANDGWLGVELVHVGRRQDVGGVRLASYTLINLRAGWPLGHGFRLEGRLENAAGEDYEPLLGFNAHDRSLFVALGWRG